MTAALARRIGGAFLALVLLVLLAASWRMAQQAGWIKPLIVLLVALASVRPRDALLVLAGLGPVIGTFGAAYSAPYSLRELIVLATLAGWSLRIAAVRYRRPLLPADLSWPIVCVTSVVLASMAVELYGQRELIGPAELDAAMRRTLDHGLLRGRHGLRGFDAGMVYLEGLAIFAATVAACAGRPAFVAQLAAMAAAGAAGAALLNVQRIIVSASASAAPLERLRELAATIRVNVSYLDVNAAGSYFALMFFPAGSHALRAGGWRRAAWWIAASALFAAAWLTGSRAAVAAIVVVAALSTLAAARSQIWTRLHTAAALGACLLAAAAFVAVFPNRVFGAATPEAVEIRVGMAQVSLGLLARHPFFGVGPGGYYDASAPLLEASPIRRFYVRENAHNNVLQVLAEFGAVGFAAFSWLFWRAIRRIREALRTGDRLIAGGATAGLIAFALTAMLGHPLLIAEVNHAFWLVLGLACGGVRLASTDREPRRARTAGLIVIAVVIGLLPWRFRGEAATLDLEHVRYGVSRWETDEDGTRYQAFTEQATLFVPSAARAVDIPLRLADGTMPATVEIRFRNRAADQVVVTPASWQVYRLMIVSSRNDPPFLPVHLRPLGDGAQAVLIGRTIVR